MRNVIKACRRHIADGPSVNGGEVVVPTFIEDRPYIAPIERYWREHRVLTLRGFQGPDQDRVFPLTDDVLVLLLPSTPVVPRRLVA